MADSSKLKGASSRENEIGRREFITRLAKKGIWIPPAILTLKARKTYAQSPSVSI